MSKFCKKCGKPWKEVGKSWLRKKREGQWDHLCGNCGSKQSPLEDTKREEQSTLGMTKEIQRSRELRDYIKEKKGEVLSPDEELIKENVKLRKTIVKLRDSLRIERKEFRESSRKTNAIEEYSREVVDLLKTYGKKLPNVNPVFSTALGSGEVAMVQVTDPHFNELINLPHNKYDISIASQRLYKLANESINIFKSRGIRNIVVAFTGDLLNSDRRRDELLNQATNRSKATFVAVDLLKEFLLHLASHFSVTVVSVLGNESRVDKEMSYSDNVLSDNYDFVIVNMLKVLFKASKTDINFGAIDVVDQVIEVNGCKVGISHDFAKATASQKATQSHIGMKYLQGEPCDYIISGHMHATLIGLYSARSASLAGSNSFNENALELMGMASQNLYLFGNGYRHVIAIDLQNTNEDECYDIQQSLMEYNCKSADKVKPKTEILKVVV